MSTSASTAAVASAAATPAAAAAAGTTTTGVCYTAALVGANEVQARLAAELRDKGLTIFRFVRVAADYYDRPLEWRRDAVGAPSVHHLCKAIVMENTRAHPDVTGVDASGVNSKYYCVIVQVFWVFFVVVFLAHVRFSWPPFKPTQKQTKPKVHCAAARREAQGAPAPPQRPRLRQAVL